MNSLWFISNPPAEPPARGAREDETHGPRGRLPPQNRSPTSTIAPVGEGAPPFGSTETANFTGASPRVSCFEMGQTVAASALASKVPAGNGRAPTHAPQTQPFFRRRRGG